MIVEVWASLALCLSVAALAVALAAWREAARAGDARGHAERGRAMSMRAGAAKVDEAVHGTTRVVRRRG